MKKLIIVLLAICFLQTGCRGQDDGKKNKTITIKENYKNTKVMKKLEESKILIYKSHDKQKFITNDTLFKLEEFDNIYVNSKKSINNNFVDYEIYDKKTLKIQREGMSFIKMPIGIHKFYDNNGNVKKEINFDENFDFSVNEVILKVQNTFNLNLNHNSNELSIGRTISREFNIPVYHINVVISNEPYTFRQIIINGKNGSIISDTIKVAEE